jgi:hypothetical protein
MKTLRSRCPVTGHAIRLSYITLAEYQALNRPVMKNGQPMASANFAPSVDYDSWGRISREVGMMAELHG